MVGSSLATRILLALHARDDDPPASRTATAVGRVVGVDDDRVATRMTLISELSALEADGLVTAEPGDDDRTAYALSDAGATTARERRASLREETVTVVDADGERDVPVPEAADAFDPPRLVRLLDAATDGRVDLTALPEDSFVDREAPLSAARDALADAAAGDPRLVLVSGAAGVGKTALLDRVAALADDRGFDVLRATCSRESTAPFAAFADADPALLGGRLLATDGGRDVDDHEALETMRTALFNDVRTRIEDRAADRPLVLALDDLQWADEATVDLFGHLARAVDGPVCLVGAFRAGGLADDHALRGDLPSLSTATQVALDPLDRAATRDLVRALLATRTVPAGFVDTVHDRTGGNPLFCTEVVEHLRETRAVRPTYDDYPTGDDALPVTDSVRDAVDARLSSLDDDERAVLQWASLAGGDAPVDLLAAASDAPRPTVADHVAALVARDLLHRSEDGDRVRFESEVVRETVRETLPESVRRDRHARLARVLRAEFDSDGTGWAGDVARHYEAAGDGATATEWYRRAGDRAREAYAHDVAHRQYEQALAAGRAADVDDDTLLDVVETLGDTRLLLGDPVDAARRFEYVHQQADDDDRRRRAHRKQADARSQHGDYERAVELADAGLALSAGRDVETCELRYQRGWAAQEMGDLDAAETAYERLLADGEALDADAHVATGQHSLGVVALYRGDLETAEAQLKRAADTREALGADADLAKTENNLGIVASIRGNLPTAIDRYETALDLYREVGDLNGLALTLSNLGHIYSQRGRLDRATDRFAESASIARRIENRTAEAAAVGGLGVLDLLRDDLDAARERFEARREMEAALGRERGVAVADRSLGRVARYDGDLETAVERYRRAIERLADIGDTRHLAVARSRLAVAFVAAGDPGAATEQAEQALDVAADADDAEVVAEANAAAATAARCRGEFDAALDHLDTARTVAGDAGHRLSEPRNALERGRVHAAAGDTRAARDALRHAVDAGDRMDASLWARLARDRIATLDDA